MRKSVPFPHGKSVFRVKSVIFVIVEQKKKELFSPGIEPGTFRVLGGCDNHYTTKTQLNNRENAGYIFYLLCVVHELNKRGDDYTGFCAPAFDCF